MVHGFAKELVAKTAIAIEVTRDKNLGAVVWTGRLMVLPQACYDLIVPPKDSLPTVPTPTDLLEG
jgi:hypothetical protein